MAFINEIKKYPKRTVATGLIGLLYACLGIFISALGPSLLDLQLLSNTTISEVSIILPVRAFGYMVGSAIAGILGEMFDHQLVIIVSTLASMVTLFIFPLIPNIYVMYSVIGLSGIANGCMNCIADCWVVYIWGTETPPFMQIVHFMFGMGALIAPFIVKPFLLHKLADFVDTTNQMPGVTTDELMIQWPFFIASFLYLLLLVLFVINYTLNPVIPIHPSRLVKSDGKDIDELATTSNKFCLKEPLTGGVKIMVIVIASLCMHAYVGLEISFGSLLTPFAVKSDLHLTKSQGSTITGVYWATYTFLRFISLILIIYLPPRVIMIGNFTIIMLSNCVLVPFANNYEWALWVGTCMMGLGCSSAYATLYAFVGQLTTITSRIAAIFVISGCAGEFVIPLVVARYLEEWPSIFLWTVLLYSSVSFACMIHLVFVQYTFLKKQKSVQPSSQRTTWKDLNVMDVGGVVGTFFAYNKSTI